MEKSLLQLLEKYNVPGPRYTSYPTVPAWLEDIGSQHFKNNLKTLKRGERFSLYFHLPFCERLCHFCGCMQVITKDHSKSREYVDFLLKEIDQVDAVLPKEARDVCQLHFGGGTPNFLKPEELTFIVDRVREKFNLLPDAEIAIEMHPRTTTEAFCENLAKLKFNRISLGVQDFNPVVQKLIRRDQTHSMTVRMVEDLRALGFDSFNFDLVYGLPLQSMEGWEKTLKQVFELRPDRLAVYSYAHVPWVRPVQRAFKDSDLPSPELKLKLFAKAYETLTSGEYELIGMDHFALESDELVRAKKEGSLHRNFMGYSTKADAHQIGFGLSSISYVAGHYFQNVKDLKQYYQRIASKELATYRGFLLSRDDALHRDLITQIMCQACVNVSAFEKRWGLDFKDYFKETWGHLDSFCEDGLLEKDDHHFQVVGRGYLFLRNIAMVFDPYLSKIREESKTPVFSRTV